MSQSSTPGRPLRIGSRGSPLALVQARQVQQALAKASGLAPEQFEIILIRTSGDKIQDRPVADAGGKGLFTKEIEEALISGAIDFAVHSSKDIPALLPAGLTLAGFLAREDPRDALIGGKAKPTAKTIAELPRNALVGTSSPRRQALLKRARPDLRIAPLRGNVETRLRKIDAGEMDAAILAVAGLKRLGLFSTVAAPLEIEAFLPAVGQGAIAIETRADDKDAQALAAAIDDPDTHIALAAERAFLVALGGSCRTPIAGHARVHGDTVSFRGLLAMPDGSDAIEAARQGQRADAAALGADAGQDIKARASATYFGED